MKRKILLLLFLLGMLPLCCSCSGSSAYAKYLAAYQYLQEVDSFMVQSVATYRSSEDLYGTLQVESGSAETYAQFARIEEIDCAVFTAQYLDDAGEADSAKAYCRGNWQYVEQPAGPYQGYRLPAKDGFARSSALEGLLDLPRQVIARQSSEQTADGLRITFQLDSKKYYQHRFPETAAGYDYGEFSWYREDPLYSVLLDENGHIIAVSGQFAMVNAGYTAFTSEQSYTLTILQYGDVALDLPALHEEDFPTIEEYAAATE